MFEGRAKQYKQDLAEQATVHLASGEEIRVVALAQEKVQPWTQFSVMGAGAALLTGSFIGDTYLPIWAGIAGAVVMLGAIAWGQWIPRRLLVRTDERLYEFKLPGLPKATVEKPLAVHMVAELPTPAAGAPRNSLSGERLWPNYGAPGEREAIARALAPGAN